MGGVSVRRQARTGDLIAAQLVRRLTLVSQPHPRPPRPVQTIAVLIVVGLLLVGIIWTSLDLLWRE